MPRKKQLWVESWVTSEFIFKGLDPEFRSWNLLQQGFCKQETFLKRHRSFHSLRHKVKNQSGPAQATAAKWVEMVGFWRLINWYELLPALEVIRYHLPKITHRDIALVTPDQSFDNDLIWNIICLIIVGFIGVLFLRLWNWKQKVPFDTLEIREK